MTPPPQQEQPPVTNITETREGKAEIAAQAPKRTIRDKTMWKPIREEGEWGREPEEENDMQDVSLF